MRYGRTCLPCNDRRPSRVPKRITNAQTVCNEKNEKGKLCNGHLKQLRTAGEAAEIHLRGDDVLSKCQTCGTFYMGPPLGHVRDPNKQHRFVEAELTALLQAAGGTLPVIKKDEPRRFCDGGNSRRRSRSRRETRASETSRARQPRRKPQRPQQPKPAAPAAPKRRTQDLGAKPKPATVQAFDLCWR